MRRERERERGNAATVASGIKLCLDRRYEGARSTEVDDTKRRNRDRYKTTASEKCFRQRKLQNHKKQTVSRRRRRRRRRFSRPPRHTKKMPRPLTKLSAKPEHQNSFHRTSKRKKRKEDPLVATSVHTGTTNANKSEDTNNSALTATKKKKNQRRKRRREMTLTTTKEDSYWKWKTLVTQQRIDRNTQLMSDNNDKKSPPREREREREKERFPHARRAL